MYIYPHSLSHPPSTTFHHRTYIFNIPGCISFPCIFVKRRETFYTRTIQHCRLDVILLLSYFLTYDLHVSNSTWYNTSSIPVQYISCFEHIYTISTLHIIVHRMYIERTSYFKTHKTPHAHPNFLSSAMASTVPGACFPAPVVSIPKTYFSCSISRERCACVFALTHQTNGNIRTSMLAHQNFSYHSIVVIAADIANNVRPVLLSLHMGNNIGAKASTTRLQAAWGNQCIICPFRNIVTYSYFGSELFQFGSATSLIWLVINTQLYPKYTPSQCTSTL